MARRHDRPEEIIANPSEARILIEDWRRAYATIRPQSSLKQRPPALGTRTLIPASPRLAFSGAGRLN